MPLARELNNSDFFVYTIIYPGRTIVGYFSTYHIFLLGLLVYDGLITLGILTACLCRKHFIMRYWRRSLACTRGSACLRHQNSSDKTTKFICY